MRWPRTRAARVALALVVLNEVRGLIMAAPGLVAIAKFWF